MRMREFWCKFLFIVTSVVYTFCAFSPSENVYLYLLTENRYGGKKMGKGRGRQQFNAIIRTESENLNYWPFSTLFLKITTNSYEKNNSVKVLLSSFLAVFGKMAIRVGPLAFSYSLLRNSCYAVLEFLNQLWGQGNE
jgi:hypothetical protein